LPVFDLIKTTGNVPEDDMRATFNLGIGLIAVVSRSALDDVEEVSRLLGEEALQIGKIV
jgi:phosphoribosylformylglycinamidine cyclo-ligase